MSGKAGKAQEKLVAAYREGLGLVAVVVVSDGAQVRVAADPDNAILTLDADENFRWCRNADDAARVAAAANASLRRRRAGEGDPCAAALESIVRAAKRLNVMLRSDQDITAEAAIVIARVTREFEQMRASGDLRAVNASYREYRLAAVARGERVVPYAQWLRTYQENLVRKAAATLKYL